MSQPITVSVQMDKRDFHDFISFDLFRHQKRWQRPLLFAVIMLVFSGICMSQIGKREGAGLLSAVLAIIALGLPLVYFGTFFHNLSKQIKSLDLPKPFYTLTLTDAGLSVWMAGQQDQPTPTHEYAWDSMYCAYRVADRIYLYAEKGTAFLLPESVDSAWKLLGEKLPAEKLHDCR